MLKGELFNTDMIRAYLEGRKRHTARPVKGDAAENLEIDVDGSVIGIYDRFEGNVRDALDYAKYRPGDFMYARETWSEMGRKYIYRADAQEPHSAAWMLENHMFTIKWHPSIHMPRSAARLFFRVTKVEVMRLDDVDEQFAREDGFLPLLDGWASGAVDGFKYFWRKTYGPAARWMWVYWTEPVSKEEAQEDGK